MQKTETGSLSLTLYKNQFKTDQDLNVRPKTLKPLLANIRKTHEDIGIGNSFLNMTPIAQEMRARVNK
jgi:hypothetical protein